MSRITTRTSHHRSAFCTDAMRPTPVLWILWIFLSVGCLFFPLVNILGYESAIAINACVVFLGGPMVIGQFSTDPVWARLWKRSAILILWSVFSALLLMLNILRVPNCDVRSGLILWALFPLGGTPPVVALTLLCERFTSKRRVHIALYFGVITASLLSTLLWLALQPPLVVYDAFTGFWAVSIYDEGLHAWQAHIPYRVMTWVGAALICHALAFEMKPTVHRAAWILTTTVGLLWFAAHADELHITRSRAYAQRVLAGHVQTEHFDIYYEAPAFSKRQVVELIADHERQYDELVAFWGIEPQHRMRSYIYASSDTRAEAMGVKSTMIARVWLNEMHLVWRGFGDPLLKHEMSHLMLRDAGRGPLRLASANGVIPAMGLVEGAASAAAWDTGDLNDHGWSAAILKNGQMEDLAHMMEASAFWAQPSRLSYTLWSSFSRWLIDTYGADRFLQAYRDTDFERAYGQELSMLVDAWLEMLESIELSAQETAAAQMRFERPSLLRRMCGRAIATREDASWASLSARDHDRAKENIAWLEAYSEHDPYLQFRVAGMWVRASESGRAEEMYRKLLRAEQTGPELAQQTRLALVDLLWVRDRYEETSRMLQHMREHPLTSSMQRAVWVREALIGQRKSAPHAHTAGRRYLARAWDYHGVSLRTDLVASAFEENSAPAAWLAYRFSAQDADVLASASLAAMLERHPLPYLVAQRFALDRLAWAGRRTDTMECQDDALSEFYSSKGINAVSDEALLLRSRCEVSGRYLDAARRIVE